MLIVLGDTSRLPEDRYTAILSTVPKTIEEALQCPPVQQLINQGAKVNDLQSCLALEIARTANLLTVGGNLRQGQSLEIAKSLISDFPGESLQDFCLCLRNGVRGAYGDIFRFDILVISEWFRKYLDQKYEAAEALLMREKEDMFKPVQPEPKVDPERHQYWLDRLKEEVNKVQVKKVSPLTEKEIKAEGQEKPKRQSHPYTAPGYQAQIDASVRRGRELQFRENYPGATEEQVKEYLDSFER